MSHFACLVIGEDPEGQLQPYSENLEVEPYAEYIDMAETLPAIEKHYNIKSPLLEVKEEYELDDFNIFYDNYIDHVKDWYGIEADDIFWGGIDKKGIYLMSTYNKNSKWDWFELGGRWRGYFSTKKACGALGEPGVPEMMGIEKKGGIFIDYKNKADQCLKSDIDFDAMVKEEEEKAAKRWDEYYSKPEGERSLFDLGWRLPYKALESRENYISYSSGISTYAVIKDGVWYEKGEMGWFGMDNCRPEYKGYDGSFVWCSEWRKLIDSLPDDTLLSVYDCHI